MVFAAQTPLAMASVEVYKLTYYSSLSFTVILFCKSSTQAHNCLYQVTMTHIFI